MNINRTTSIMILACLLVLSCSGGTMPEPPDEAQSEGQKAWDKYFTQCGDSYYTNWGLSIGVCEYRSVSFPTKARPLREADRLNNISWVGTSFFQAKTMRCHYRDGWEDWRSGANDSMYITLTKRDGKWIADTPYSLGGLGVELKKVQCSDVPK
jgi:hypothetical protein